MPWTLLALGALASLPIAAASTIPCVLPLLVSPVACPLLLLIQMMIFPLVVGLALLVIIRPREGTPNLVLGVGLIIPQTQKAQPNALAPKPNPSLAHPQATREAIREPLARLQNRMESPLQNRLQTQSPLQSWRLPWEGPLFPSPQLPPFG